MSEVKTVSRRNAAMVIAGTLAASGTSAAGSLRSSSSPAGTTGFANVDHQQIAGALQSVRRAHGSVAVAKAFDRCKAALQMHELCEASVIAPELHSRDAAAQDAALYRHAEPSTVLAKVIVRELDAMPTTDAGWMERFGDLEAAFQMHVRTAAAVQRAS